MARYPTFEEYQQRGNFQDGIKRCDDLLKKNPTDIQLLTVKLQLLYATKQDGAAVLDNLLSIQPSIVDLRELITIEEAVVQSQSDEFPRPKTAGPAMSKLWDNAFKASSAMNHKLDLLSLRFSRAIVDNRIADAQQALIQLKALQPRNRVVYMAHAALTQLLSTSKDDLQSRLALSLARKAVTERFDDDKALDCRVPGQIFALQKSQKDIESIANRPFKDSKQVHDALLRPGEQQANGTPSTGDVKDPSNVTPAEWLRSEVLELKAQFSKLIETFAPSTAVLAFAGNSIRLYYTATTSLNEDRSRAKVDACFLSISSLVRAFEQTDNLVHLLNASYLAELLLKQNEHIHEARMILVYLYMRLGLGSLALRMFDSLRVKEIQYDTVGHALFTRVSLTHPHPTDLTKRRTADPFHMTTQALGMYDRCEEKLAETEAGVLSHGQTGMIFDLQELRDKLRSSLTRRIMHLESRRTGRLINSDAGDSAADISPRVTANWVELTDSRDFAATFNYGYNVEKVLHGVKGKLPSRDWILYSLAADSAWCLATGSPTTVIDTNKLVEELETARSDMRELKLHADGVSAPGMKSAEYLAGDLACQVLKMLVKLATGPTEPAVDLKAIHGALDRLDVDGVVKGSDVLAQSLSTHYAYADVLRSLAKACTLAKTKMESGVDELQKLRDTAKAHFSAIRSHAGERAKSIKAADVEELMAEDASISESVAAFGKNASHSFAELVAASAREGWEGVAKIVPG
ncbi:hypothetical protein LTR37_016163 [Vermiconidia calcicola]|uniref:Uncharacterized protein n=1 Tax=Vermiconidia calcicola TaxID=1690605 RepID=A0ACC3MNQ1_9PEZI|nr:hypothetical protein LTR37_016163 [Vermiconidia calcicola]